MIHEFAVEPECFRDPKAAKLLLESFGIERARVIGTTQTIEEWRSTLIEDVASEMEPKHREVLVEIFKFKTSKFVVRRRQAALKRVPWDDATIWLDNILTSHREFPYRGLILADSAAATNESSICIDDLFEDLGGAWKSWEVSTSEFVPRRATPIADYVGHLLEASSVVRFIDYRFDPEKAGGKWRPILQACIQVAVSADYPKKTFEYHTVVEPRTLKFLRQQCERVLPRELPEGVELEIVPWRDLADTEAREATQLLHGRYILTDLGAYGLDLGLDEGAPAETQEISLKGETFRKQLWQRFERPSPTFESEPSFRIRGNRRPGSRR